MNYNKLSRSLYRAARISRDLNAVSRGPEAIAQRMVRRSAYKMTNKALAQFLKGLFGK